MKGVKVSNSYLWKTISHPQKHKTYLKIYKRWLSALNESLEANTNQKDDNIKSKILYNELFVVSKKERKAPPVNTGPIFLKFLEEKKENVENLVEKQAENVHFPYQVDTKYLKKLETNDSVKEVFSESFADLTPLDNVKVDPTLCDFSKANIQFEDPKKWNLDDDDVVNDSIDDNIMLGTWDPKTPVSSVPCGGCGALLHCSNPSIPGFLPQEVFKEKTEEELRSELCKRCHFLKEFDVALGVNVSPEEYTQIISQIKDKRALAIVLIDMTDFPCSINPEIFKLLGTKSFFIVGNKVDLLIREGKWQITQLETSLRECLIDRGVNMKNILHVGLISAKTGYGVEELINKLHKLWAVKGDVYIIGCTNSGKSTLFNTLINSDYCKVQAMDLLQRATISAWPGTTLNLLKFPLTSPTGWRLFARSRRLQFQNSSLKEKAFKKLIENIDFRIEQIPLSAVIKRTNFLSSNSDQNEKPSDIEVYETDMSIKDIKPPGIRPNDATFNLSKWCYDTPGVVSKDQIINFLTTPELLLTVPRKMLFPRNFHLYLGSSLFIAGLARIDFIQGPKMAWFTVYASSQLPITVTKTSDASYVYKELLGSEYFRVPFGGEARLSKWPDLSSKIIEINSKNSKEAAADVVLSNAGWVSITVPSAHRCTVEAWTPEGRGIYIREIPVIRFGHQFKGPKIRGTPAFKNIMKEISPKKLEKYLEYINLGLKK